MESIISHLAPPLAPARKYLDGGAKLFSADHPSDIIPCISKECPLAHKIIPPAHRRSPSALQSPLHIRKNIKSEVSAAHKTPSPPVSSSPIRFTTRIRPRRPHTHISPPTPPTRNRRLTKSIPTTATRTPLFPCPSFVRRVLVCRRLFAPYLQTTAPSSAKRYLLVCLLSIRASPLLVPHPLSY